jgi:hypothetical protein
MRKQLTIALLVFVGLAVPGFAAAQDCQYQSFRVDLTTTIFIDPIPPFDLCMVVEKVVGTLNGSYQICMYYADFVPSTDIFLYGLDQVQVGHFYATLMTKKGDIEVEGFAWQDGDEGLETGYAKVMGGTGDFEDATGYLSYRPRFPSRPAEEMEAQGYTCTP